MKREQMLDMLLEKKTFTSPQQKTKEKIFDRAFELFGEQNEIDSVMNQLQEEYGHYADLWDIVVEAQNQHTAEPLTDQLTTT